MKIRNGFVSNSSSSSFLVGFDINNIPKNEIEMRKTLFSLNSDKFYYCNDNFSKKEISNIIWNDFINLKPISDNYDDAIKILECGILHSMNFNFNMKYPSLPKFDDHEDIENYSNNIRKYFIELFKFLYKKYKNKVFYIFKYSDNDGDIYGTIEHGDIFDNLVNLRISNH